jgi:hypothetical protein
MYIRTISRKNKDGSQATYVQLAHNERNATTGQAKATVLYNFGRLESFDVEQLTGRSSTWAHGFLKFRKFFCPSRTSLDDCRSLAGWHGAFVGRGFAGLCRDEAADDVGFLIAKFGAQLFKIVFTRQHAPEGGNQILPTSCFELGQNFFHFAFGVGVALRGGGNGLN